MTATDIRSILLGEPLDRLLQEAARLRDAGHGAIVTYSRKVFIPLTRLCRDQCHYCTFATTPSKVARPYLTEDEVLAIARAGARAGCHEALFTLGDKPELRYAAARDQLTSLGCSSTIEYLARMCDLVNRETSLLPHVNPGVMSKDEIALLRSVTVSQGMMLESTAERLCDKGQVHYGSPDKHPRLRLQTIHHAGELAVPFTSGILIGLGETRDERIDALLALKDLQDRHGHLQEVIIQNLRVKPGTRLADAPEPGFDDLRWTIAAARLVFGPEMNIQAPPNLSPADYPLLLAAGINDWGGVSPVTPDHVNPEMPWPQIETLRRATSGAGKILVERLPIYPRYAQQPERWLDPAQVTRVMHQADATGYGRTDSWSPGQADTKPVTLRRPGAVHFRSSVITQSIARATRGEVMSDAEIVGLFGAFDDDFEQVCRAADQLRRDAVGDVVRYVVNRNLNYTNVCTFHCTFCAFSKSPNSNALRGPAYDLAIEEISRRCQEAWDRGATEVCMQGGIHPDYSGATYLEILRSVKRAVPGLHVHAFSPLEVVHGAETLGISVELFLRQLKEAGLGTLPGTAAEILDDEVRAVLCPDKLNSEQWLTVVETAHRIGLRTTATIMFGHMEAPIHWARHLSAIRRLQERTGGFTEFVPLPFIHMEAPIYFKGRARKGPTYREAILMHAVARLALHPVIPNIQVSWVKMGADGVRACLQAGANDLGGTLMNESISRAAGTQHGQELPPAAMDDLILSAGRMPQQRTTLYGLVDEGRRQSSYRAEPLTPVIQTPAGKRARVAAAEPQMA